MDELIGQFGVGFYSVFMVAESVRDISQSYNFDTQRVVCTCTELDYYSINSGERVDRGTSVIFRIKEDAKEFLQVSRLRDIIRKHSDFVTFPI